MVFNDSLANFVSWDNQFLYKQAIKKAVSVVAKDTLPDE